MSTQPEDPSQHPFVRAPHRTVLSLSFWVLVSILAEPLTGLVDTAFISRLGAAPLASLGIGAVVLGSLFWVFNFLQIGTQTETGNFLGQGDRPRARALCGLALVLATGFGMGIIAVGLPLLGFAATAMGDAYLRLDNPLMALDAFRRALGLNPDLVRVRTQVAELARQTEEG